MIYLKDLADVEYQTKEASGCDVRSTQDLVIKAGSFAIVKTGVSILASHEPMFFTQNGSQTISQAFLDDVITQEIQVRGRSGLAAKGILAHVGTIDSDYRGEIGVILYNLSGQDFQINKGDRVGQLVGAVSFKLGGVSTKDVERDSAGFGTTGTK